MATSAARKRSFEGPDFAKKGDSMDYGPWIGLTGQYRQAAAYVDRVLKGSKPGDLPVQPPEKYTFVINLKTAWPHDSADAARGRRRGDRIGATLHARRPLGGQSSPVRRVATGGSLSSDSFRDWRRSVRQGGHTAVIAVLRLGGHIEQQRVLVA